MTVPRREAVSLGRPHLDRVSARPYTFVIARAADDIRAANLTIDDGSVVTATVDNGWGVAWWPGPHHLASAQLTTDSGTRTQTFPAYPWDVHNCNGGGPHGVGPGGG